MRTEHSKVTFANRYGITLAANLYRPKDGKGKPPAIAVSGPFGAVKEQSSGLYAQEMAACGPHVSQVVGSRHGLSKKQDNNWLDVTYVTVWTTLPIDRVK